jgi:hypothetical protein
VIIDVLLAMMYPLIRFSSFSLKGVGFMCGFEISTASVSIITSTKSRPAALMVEPVSTKSTAKCVVIGLFLYVEKEKRKQRKQTNAVSKTKRARHLD